MTCKYAMLSVVILRSYEFVFENIISGVAM
jgi:hypothetical protein